MNRKPHRPLVVTLGLAHARLLAEMPGPILKFRELVCAAYTMYPWRVFDSDEDAVRTAAVMLKMLKARGMARRVKNGYQVIVREGSDVQLLPVPAVP